MRWAFKSSRKTSVVRVECPIVWIVRELSQLEAAFIACAIKDSPIFGDRKEKGCYDPRHALCCGVVPP